MHDVQAALCLGCLVHIEHSDLAILVLSAFQSGIRREQPKAMAARSAASRLAAAFAASRAARAGCKAL